MCNSCNTQTQIWIFNANSSNMPIHKQQLDNILYRKHVCEPQNIHKQILKSSNLIVDDYTIDQEKIDNKTVREWWQTINFDNNNINTLMNTLKQYENKIKYYMQLKKKYLKINITIVKKIYI